MFLSPDLDAPGGGVRIIYAMVEALEAAGIDAAVWQGQEGFSSRWFRHKANVVVGPELTLNPGDLLVMPELGGARYQHLVAGARVVLLNQRHFYTMFGAKWDRASSEAYPGWPNAVGAIVTSQAIERFLTALVPPRFPVWSVPVFVDDEMFLDRPKKRKIAVMLNRRTDDLASILELIRRDQRLPKGWEFATVGGMTSSMVAETLAESAIFINLSERDGFSLPGAEAMAAGAYVVGFHGDGAREYMRPEFSTTVEEPDLVGLAQAVVSAACRYDTDPDWVADTRARARGYIRGHYSRERFDQQVVELFTRIQPLDIGQPRAVRVRHYSWLGYQVRRRKLRTGLRRLRESLGPSTTAIAPPPPNLDSPMAGVSVVIPHYGDPALALSAASDVMAQDTRHAVQVIVVDDASPTPFPETAGVEVVRRSSNGGFGAAANTGAARATQPWLLVLNSDMRLQPGFLDAFVEAAQEVQPAVCSPQLVEGGHEAPTANLFTSAQPWSLVGALAPLARWRDRGRLDRRLGHDTSMVPGQLARTDWLTGACLLLPREEFELVGGFDERFHMFYEELDLMRRLAQRGVPAWYLGDLRAEHAGGGSTAAGTRVPGLMRSHFVYARKYHFARRLRLASEAVALVNLAYNLIRDAAGKKVDARATYAVERKRIDTAWKTSAAQR